LTVAIHKELINIKELLFDEADLAISDLKTEHESQEYGASSFRVDGLLIQYRVSKITATKTGQFVTIWKRNAQGSTQAFEASDELDFMLISSRDKEQLGLFLFPKSVLIDKGIVATKHQAGKRGIRVYPPWDKPTSKQAEKTQQWQTKYFLTIDNNHPIDSSLAKKLLKIPNIK
jgi:hypothetical protein